MATNPCKLRPSELCRLLNSTPLGEVINVRKLKRHRERAGLRIGDGRSVDLVRYVAWLIQVRHAPRPESAGMAKPAADWEEAARGAAALGSRRQQRAGHGQKLTSKQETLVAALLTEPTNAAAAAKAGVGQTTLYRWLQRPEFQAAYCRARREIVNSAISRMQSATGQAVESLLAVARDGRRDADRVRAAVALLDRALPGSNHADAVHDEEDTMKASPMDTDDVVQILSARLRQLDAAELPADAKSRLTATLADALLRAIGVSVLDERMQALQAVLLGREDKER